MPDENVAPDAKNQPDVPTQTRVAEAPIQRNAPAKVADRPHWITIALGLLSPLVAVVAVWIASQSLKTNQQSMKVGQRAYLTRLSRGGGATLPELMKAFKWQAHSVRGFISVLASKHGFKTESSKVDGVRTYRIN